MTTAKLLLLILTLAAGTSASAYEPDPDARPDELPPSAIGETATLQESGDSARFVALPENAACGNVAPEGVALQQPRSVDPRCRYAENSAAQKLISQ
jgi:hypothetical protein